MNDSVVIKRRNLGYFLMVILICLVYANSFQASWHLDDYANIVYNKKLHLNDLGYSSIYATLYASPGDNGQLYRPVACITFALNWYLGQNRVFGYHVVNLLIHCLTAIMLMKTVLLLFRTPSLVGRYEESNAPYWVALMATTLWAIHPIQTQAVTYIVQRMTSLAGLLYIVGLFCFLKARLNSEQWKAVSWYVGAFSACLLALGSKENAIIFPLALILIEVSFFRPILFSSRRQRIIFSSVITLIVFVGTLAVLVISEDRMTSWFESYAIRDFNHSERLLTQFRILPYYLFQIVYPNPANLSLEHDFIVSTGLLTPWSTLLSVTLVFGALWSLLFFLPKAPLLCFGGLFFLLQHVVESSFLPLELIFEHRNYVPTMFLFTGVASGLYRLVFFYKDRNILLSRLLVLSSALVVFFIGMGTYSRNTDWRTERSLWEDTVAKAPENSRALHNLAWGYYEPIGDNDKALELYQQSIGKQTHRKDSYGNSYHNIGNIYFNKKAYAKAIDYFEKSLGFDPYNLKTHLRLVHSYMGLGDWDKADLAIEEALKGHSHKNDLYRLRGAVLLNKNDPKEAIQWFRKTESMQWKDLSGIGQCLHLLGYHEKSDFFLRSAQAISQNDMFLVLNRLDLYLSNNQMDKAKEMADLFVRSLSASEVGDYLQKLAADNSFYPLQYQRIIPVIEETLHEALDQLEKNEELMALTR